MRATIFEAVLLWSPSGKAMSKHQPAHEGTDSGGNAGGDVDQCMEAGAGSGQAQDFVTEGGVHAQRSTEPAVDQRGDPWTCRQTGGKPISRLLTIFTIKVPHGNTES